MSSEEQIMSDIFIAHVEEDAAVALEIALGLEKAGYKTWCYEIDSVPGPSYIVRTGEAVEQSQAVIVVISPNSLASNQVTKEVVRAHESSKHFIPILRDISHVEFQQRQPEWREAIGAATSIRITKGGVASILPQIIDGIKILGIKAGGKPDAVRIARIQKVLDEVLQRPLSEKIEPSTRSQMKKADKSGKKSIIVYASLLIVIIIVVVIFFPRGGNEEKQDQELIDTMPTSTTTLQTTSTSAAVTTELELKPDLAILDIAWSPQNPSAGESVTFTVAVTNQGKTDANTFYLYFFVDGTYKESIQIDEISAGATLTENFDWTAQMGTHNIEFNVDKTDLVAETDEINNDKEVALPITLQPDLIIKEITFSQFPSSGSGLVKAFITIENRGNGTAAPSHVGCSYEEYLRGYKQGVLTPVPSIPPGGTVTVISQEWWYMGDTIFQATVDYDNVLPESNENNNSMSSSI